VRRLPASLAREVGGRDSITIRASRIDDTERLEWLAELAGRALPSSPLLVAESGRDLIAAISIATGDVVTDPFRVTTDLVELLRLRADQLHQFAA
jgi:hypothetical protein